jgi:hypothetical protein
MMPQLAAWFNIPRPARVLRRRPALGGAPPARRAARGGALFGWLVPPADVRQAIMVAGDLPTVAQAALAEAPRFGRKLDVAAFRGLKRRWAPRALNPRAHRMEQAGVDLARHRFNMCNCARSRSAARHPGPDRRTSAPAPTTPV